MRNVRVFMNTSRSDIEGSWDDSDNWDRPDTQGTLEGLQAFFVSDKPGNEQVSWYSESGVFAVEPDKNGYVYVVVVDHYSGDTFGSDDNYFTIMDVFGSAEEANGLEKVIDEHSFAGRYGAGGTVIRSYKVHYKDKEYYAFWTGYFEGLNSVRVYEVRVGFSQY